MIIGNGLLARAFAPAFTDHPTVAVFASGVSNSKEERPEAFERERLLLEAALARPRQLLYFSTCSIDDPALQRSPYVLHKRAMEALIAARRADAAVFRLPQVVGRTPNPYTLTNYLAQHIESGAPFQLWSLARRNLVDVADVATIVAQLLRDDGAAGRVTNVACPFSVAVPELVAIFEAVLGKRANYHSVAAGGCYPIDVAAAMAAAERAGLRIGADYIDNLIRKYYAH